MYNLTGSGDVEYARWLAPELMDSDSSDGTIQSDVYAFGMTALEVRILSTTKSLGLIVFFSLSYLRGDHHFLIAVMPLKQFEMWSLESGHRKSAVQK